jgi:hypothetical protein
VRQRRTFDVADKGHDHGGRAVHDADLLAERVLELVATVQSRVLDGIDSEVGHEGRQSVVQPHNVIVL